MKPNSAYPVQYITRGKNALKKQNKGPKKKTHEKTWIKLQVPALLMKNALCELSYEYNNKKYSLYFFTVTF
jgi:hypothetical protein